jgi:hypothetical protein
MHLLESLLALLLQLLKVCQYCTTTAAGPLFAIASHSNALHACAVLGRLAFRASRHHQPCGAAVCSPSVCCLLTKVSSLRATLCVLLQKLSATQNVGSVSAFESAATSLRREADSSGSVSCIPVIRLDVAVHA